jgi:hypothetical protein
MTSTSAFVSLRRMEIAIIGAGIAGLTAARDLDAAGHGVRVFDKGRRVGGRASTRDADGGRLRFDHGAQYFTARDAAMKAQTAEWVRRGVAQRWDGRIGVAEGGAVETKTDNPERFVGTPGMSALAEDLAVGLSVESGVRIEALHHEDSRWRLMDAEQRVYEGFDAVLVATPAPQAALLVEEHSEPLRTTCAKVRMAPCWAVTVSFVLKLPLECDGVFFADGPLRWAARDSSKPHRIGAEDWVLQASEAWSEQHLESPPDDVNAALLRTFFESTGIDHHAPAFSRAHRWRYATPTPALDLGAEVDPNARLAVAGDWLRGARVEGAYLSGQTAAQRLTEIA